MPIIGTPASAFESTLVNEFDSARKLIQSTIGALSPQAQATAIQQAIVTALDGAKLQHDHVTVSNYDPAAGNITIDLGLSNTLGISQRAVNFNLGLPALPFSVTSSFGLMESVGWRYDNLGFGQVNGKSFLDTSPLDELKVSFDTTTAPGAYFDADAGLFSVKATPLPTFGLHAGIAIDVGGKVARA